MGIRKTRLKPVTEILYWPEISSHLLLSPPQTPHSSTTKTRFKQINVERTKRTQSYIGIQTIITTTCFTYPIDADIERIQAALRAVHRFFFQQIISVGTFRSTIKLTQIFSLCETVFGHPLHVTCQIR